MSEKRRRWDRLVEDDPLAGLINLFDVWMVFSIALLLALVACLRLPQTLSGGADGTIGRLPRRSKPSPAATASCLTTESAVMK